MSTNHYDASLEDEEPYFLPIGSKEPAGLSPTRGIIRQGPAVWWSLFVCVVTYFAATLLVWYAGVAFDHNTMWDRTEMNAMVGAYFAAWFHLIPIAINTALHAMSNPHLWPSWFDTQTANLLDMLQAYPLALGFRLATPIVAAVVVGRITYLHLLRPQSRAQHAKGARFVTGKAAIVDLARRLAEPRDHKNAWAAAKPHVLTGRWPTAWRAYQRVRNTPMFMKIHPDLPMVSKDLFAAGMLVSGAPGAGKTQVLNTFLSQIIGEGPYADLAPEGGHKALIYDIKKEFTRLYRRPAILSPEDSRSMVWDIAADMADDVAIAAMAGALIRENEKNPFFDRAAKQLFIGCTKSLLNDHGLDWGFFEHASVLSLPVADMLALLDKHDPAARQAYDMAFASAKQNLQGGDDNTTVNNIMASLNVASMVIFSLARAWGRPDKKAVKFSVKEWVSDDYTGPRQIFVHGTKDSNLRAWITVLFDTLIRTIVHDLDSNEHGRHLFLVVDEFPTLPAADFKELCAVARDRGAVPILLFQDENQLEETYGQNGAKTLLAMPSMRIFTKMRGGTDGVIKTSEGLGKNHITITTVTESSAPGGAPTKSTAAHVEPRLVVAPIQLTAPTLIGRQDAAVRQRWQKWPNGSAIRALLLGVGPHVYRLDWPTLNTSAMKKYANRDGFVPAAWTAPLATKQPAAQTDATAGGASAEAVPAKAPVVEPGVAVTNAENLETTPAPAADAHAEQRGDESEPEFDVTDPMDDELPQQPKKVIAMIDVADPHEPANPHKHHQQPKVREPKAAHGKTEEVDEDVLDDLIKEIGEEEAADHIADALDVPGASAVLAVAKIVDLYHDSKTPTPTTGPDGKPVKPKRTVPLFQ
ncbi:type IV secretory pathway TraG/TraD family ATPase VirD4 [Paraburkholderia unamae]|uniref:type IV secretion system DNA-binding domain-containing protein n=1 Tax=Paraburkholderia unamae TaxID=219649 RepID=UPI000DC43A62|nr:type IV secretion system DNA-binding domain-containing protein [Paraburkholderia unamae]RAR66885.1 type IV secretory pathway TraG/TraD family ATPase VirD4 [Paraburkholderia unamae]